MILLSKDYCKSILILSLDCLDTISVSKNKKWHVEIFLANSKYRKHAKLHNILLSIFARYMNHIFMG